MKTIKLYNNFSMWKLIILIMANSLKVFAGEDASPPLNFRIARLNSVISKIETSDKREPINIATLNYPRKLLLVGVFFEPSAQAADNRLELTLEIALKRAIELVKNELESKITGTAKPVGIYSMPVLGDDAFIVEFSFSDLAPNSGAGYPATFYLPILKNHKTSIKVEDKVAHDKR